MFISRFVTAIRWRVWKSRRVRYLKTHFQNGDELVRSYLDRQPCGQAILNDGTILRHPPGRVGLAGMLLEVWYDQTYTGSFYSPRPGDRVVDAGANIGALSLLLARLEPRCQITAYEPFAENYDLLLENLGPVLGTTVAAHRAAIAGSTAVAIMTDGGQRSQDHRITQTTANDPQAIPTRSFADVLADTEADDIALFKCDIEGSEYELFEQANPKLLQRVCKFAIEYHDVHRPGTLALLERQLVGTHHLDVRPDPEGGYGMLYATRK